MLPFWILFLIGPTNPFVKEDVTEVETKSEKNFISDKRFFLPLHFLVFTNTIVWIWGLIVVSDEINIDHWVFNSIYPKSTKEFWYFSASIGVLAGLDATAGHELLHKREWYNKVIGTLPFTKFFYTHFFDEHI
jgi:hypothetical protein